MISKFEDFNKLFEEMDKKVDEKLHFFVIGGAMLLFHGIKETTKDIDIIVMTKNEFITSQKLLKKLNFKTKIPTFEYKKVDLSQIFIRDDFRIDIFNEIVCKGFKLSNEMVSRSELILNLKNIKVSLCSFEDVFLFKTFTEREGDITDCITLALRKKMNWEEVLSELQNQISLSGKPVWITWIGERFDILEEKGLEIPIMKELNKLRDKYFDEYEKKHNKKEDK